MENVWAYLRANKLAIGDNYEQMTGVAKHGTSRSDRPQITSIRAPSPPDNGPKRSND